MTADSHTQTPSPAPANIDDNATTPFQAVPLAPGTQIGDHTICRLLAKADSGFTYSADDGHIVIQEYFPLQFALRDQDGISLLLCDAEFDSDFEQGLSEFLLLARVLSQIDHPGRISHYEENDGAAWYAVDLTVRASLADLLETGQRLPEETLKTILYSTVTYLDTAHGAGTLHLELAPQRILLAEDDKIFICGFCTDKLHYPPEDSSEAHDYRAPELASFRGQLGPWTDYYALGAILYQCACRAAPPNALNRLGAADRGQRDPLTPAVEAGKGYFSHAILALIDQLLELKPSQRPQDAETLISALDDAGLRLDKPESHNKLNGASHKENSGTNKPLPAKSDRTRRTQSDAGLAVSKRLRGATAIALSALGKAGEAVKSPKTGKTTIPASTGSSTPKPIPNKSGGARDASATEDPLRQSAVRQEPVFSESRKAFEETLKVLEVERTEHPPLEIANDLESAGEVLSAKHYDDFSLHPAPRPSEPSRRSGGRSKRSASVPGSGLNPLARISKIFKPRWLLGILIALATLLVIYLLASPETSPGLAPQRATIEIIGATSIVPSPKPQPPSSHDLTIADAPSPPPKDFSQDNDLERVKTYRDAAQLSLLSDPHLARARKFLSQGHLLTPVGANAYSEFMAALRIDPHNSAAERGITEVVRDVLAKIRHQLEQHQFADARIAVALAKKTLGSHERLDQTALEIDQAEADWLNQREQQAAIALAKAERAQQERARQQKIQSLLAQAVGAFDADKFIDPPGENALTLYRAALDLDPANQRARNGIGSIAAVYLRRARDTLSRNDLANTSAHLQIATAIDPTHAGVETLSKQLQRRQYLVTEQQRLQAEADARISKAQEMAEEQDGLNLASGIKSYYDGDYPEAFQFLKSLADRNDPRAQVRVARMLLEGRGTDRDKPKAIAMFSAALGPVQLAASQGKAWAQSDLADYYYDGLVIDADQRTAAFWYRKAADQGYGPAQTNLGVLYMTGYEGVSPNRAVAVHWFSEAALQGNRAAIDNLRVLGEPYPNQGGG